jgi:N-acetylmuramoyl-L-alanine amidase
LLKKIARNDKIQESRELAQDIQQSLSHRLELVSRSEKNRGVKKAPFVVLIGANMPSVLVETSFLSNLKDEHLLREPRQRERIALGIYRGVAEYLKSLNSLSVDKQKVASDRQTMVPLEAAATAVASAGNPK